MQALAHGEQSHGGLTTRSTMTKSITRNSDGETQITVEGSGTNTGMPLMNQTIMVEAKPLESVEAFGMKASSGNIWWGVMGLVILMAMYKWVKK